MTDPMELAGRLDDCAQANRDLHRDALASILTEAAACIREMVEWRPIETFELSGQEHPVIVAAPDRDGGWIVGEAWFRAEEGDSLWENGWWWAGTSPGEYHDSPIIEMNYGPPKWWKPLPLPPAPGAEA
ncbi:hypothetical protein [Brevundimonas olei]|uniref:hypothetical protein n=1 Tax=Brevundimonas olei TaxID=657642 RepID=UPI0031DAE1DE